MTNIFEAIFVAIFNVVSFLIHLILLPIDLLIESLLPELSEVFTSISDFLSLALSNVGYALSITGIPPAAIALVAAFWVFKLTLPINVWFIKLALGWWHKLKP